MGRRHGRELKWLWHRGDPNQTTPNPVLTNNQYGGNNSGSDDVTPQP
ncbi:hypothetical protein A2U01_0063379, partial [Trifolium medium]|nr:hypothetical protein [Trifolium medium]